jgi:hypothetical protein
MVKLPVIVYNHHDKTEVINSALHLQQKLENLARQQRQAGGRSIRPIVLFQAQPRTADDNTTFEKLKEQLLKLRIPEEQIKIKTAAIDELRGVDLLRADCPVRYIITVNALKEGWDCPFAYILASLADRSSAVDVEQILGRVLRQPYVMKHAHPLLNVSYVLTASAKFNDTLQNIVRGLQASGFSDKDYRQRDLMPEEQKGTARQETLESFFFPEQQPAGLARSLALPQFFLQVPANTLFGTDSGAVPLNQEALLKAFRLADEDTKIPFDQIQSDLYKIDLEETRKDEYAPAFTKIEDQQVKDPVLEYVLAAPQEGQVKAVAHQLMQIIGDLFPIPDQDIRLYVERILGRLTAEQLLYLLAHKYSFTDRLKAKIRSLAERYAEGRFNDLVKVGQVSLAPSWKLPEAIVPGRLGPSIGNSLYEREGQLNGFEERVILELGTLPNIAFWHRNLGRAKGFHLNGFLNHYPDFLLVTKSGKTILLETKGDNRDNSDSEAKLRLGNKWADLAGPNFLYFMVFEHRSVEGAYTLEKAKELVRMV